jgi:hypothetical protein
MARLSEVGIKEGRINIHARVGLRDMRRTIQGQPIRAAVEVIINSDDSYRLVEEEGDISKKTIKVFFEARARQVTILDHAKGMSFQEVKGIPLGKRLEGFSVQALKPQWRVWRTE